MLNHSVSIVSLWSRLTPSKLSGKKTCLPFPQYTQIILEKKEKQQMQQHLHLLMKQVVSFHVLPLVTSLLLNSYSPTRLTRPEISTEAP